jgi:hypothetical protein
MTAMGCSVNAGKTQQHRHRFLHTVCCPPSRASKMNHQRPVVARPQRFLRTHQPLHVLAPATLQVSTWQPALSCNSQQRPHLPALVVAGERAARVSPSVCRHKPASSRHMQLRVPAAA